MYKEFQLLPGVDLQSIQLLWPVTLHTIIPPRHINIEHIGKILLPTVTSSLMIATANVS